MDDLQNYNVSIWVLVSKCVTAGLNVISLAAVCGVDLHAHLTVLQPHPQLFVVFLLHVIDYLALVLEGVRLLDAGHEVSLNYGI